MTEIKSSSSSICTTPSSLSGSSPSEDIRVKGKRSLSLIVSPGSNRPSFDSSITQHLLTSEKAHRTSNPLRHHNISSICRSKMVDWQFTVLSKCHMSDASVFRSTKLLDLFLKGEKSILEQNSLHVLGVAAMIVATKFEEKHPFSVKFACKTILHHKYTPLQVGREEAQFLHTIKFKVAAPTILDFIYLFADMIGLPNESPQMQLALYIAKMSLLEQGFSKNKESLIALASLHSACQLAQKVGICGEYEIALALEEAPQNMREVIKCAKDLLLNAQFCDQRYRMFAKILGSDAVCRKMQESKDLEIDDQNILEGEEVF